MELAHPEFALLTISLLLFLAVLASKTSGRLGVPSLLLFMFLGWAFGPTALDFIRVENFEWLRHTGILALALILFSGGLDTNFGNVRPIVWRSVSLATLGVLVTAIVTAVAGYLLLPLTMAQAFLLGSIVSSTDAAAVFSVLRSKSIDLKFRLKPLLEFESGSNDPMALLLTTVAISWVIGEQTSGFFLGAQLILNLGIGAGFGLLLGYLTIKLMNKITLPYEGLFLVLVLAIVMFTYIGTELALGNGLLAVYCAGIILGKNPFIHKRSVMKFFDGVAWIMQIIIFISLGLVLKPNLVAEYAYEGIIVALVLMFFARTLAVYISLLPFPKVSHREKLFISWVGLKGVAPLVFALFPFLVIDEGMPAEIASAILNIVYFVVVFSVLVQGTSLTYVARWLHLDVPSPLKTNYPLEIEHRVNFQSHMQEIIVPPYCSCIGKTLVELNIPTDALIVLISRGDQFIMPNGSTEIFDHDKLLVLATTQADLDAVYETLGIDLPAST